MEAWLALETGDWSLEPLFTCSLGMTQRPKTQRELA